MYLIKRLQSCYRVLRVVVGVFVFNVYTRSGLDVGIKSGGAVLILGA